VAGSAKIRVWGETLARFGMEVGEAGVEGVGKEGVRGVWTVGGDWGPPGGCGRWGNGGPD